MKLTLVSIMIHGRRYSAFAMLNGADVCESMLRDMFPVFRNLPRGTTYSYN